MDISRLKLTTGQTLRAKVGYQSYESDVVKPMDFMTEWNELDLQKPAYSDLPEEISLLAGESKNIPLTKGAGHSNLILYYPDIEGSESLIGSDLQSQVITPSFLSDSNP